MINVEVINSITVVSFTEINRITALNAESVKTEINNLFNKPDMKLVINLAGISFIDSTGFSVFLSIMKTANNMQGAFRFCQVEPAAMELFKLLQLHTIFEIYHTLDESLQNF